MTNNSLLEYLKALINIRILLCLLLLFVATSPEEADAKGEISGYAAIEADLFTHTPLHGTQKRHAMSLSAGPEYYRAWNGGNGSFTFAPFLRIDSADNERTHFDIRELFLLYVYDRFELGLGFRKIFWGVTESQHLVDIINQTDAIESIDGEEKLGQPMVSFTVPLDFLEIADLGTVELYIMPYFRERTFPGKNGRLRGELIVDTDMTTYGSDAGRYNIDLALRWSRSIGDYDLALSYFTGTGRAPTLKIGTDGNGNTVLTPHYGHIDRAGLEAQKVQGDWLLKLEAILQSAEGKSYGAWTGGFEYSLTSILGTHMDIGLIGEWSHDTRGSSADTAFEDDLMFGLRLTVNDLGSTDALLGVVLDIDSPARSIFLESSRRYGDHLRIRFEANLFLDIPANDLLFGLRDDDFVKIEAAYWF